MNKTIKKLNITMIIGILAVWVSGSLFHFVYDWTGKNTFIGMFFPINESTWEHMKLVFLPMNLYGIYTWYALKDRFAASGFAILLGANVATWAIPFLYYTYMGVLGFSRMWLDIACFFVAVLIGFALEYHVLKKSGNESFVLGTWIMAVIDFVMAAAFVSCSYGAPALGIFAKFFFSLKPSNFWLLLTIALSAVIYLSLIYLLKVDGIEEIIQAFKNKIAKKRSAK